MSTYSGRYGAITIEISGTETLIGELNTWAISLTGGETDTSVFGDIWGKTDVGMLGWSATASGFYDPADAAQTKLWTLFKSGALDGTMRFYIQYSTTSADPIKYWKPDVVTDPVAGIRVTGYNPGQTHSGVSTFDITLSGSGPVEPVSTTVP